MVMISKISMKTHKMFKSFTLLSVASIACIGFAPESAKASIAFTFKEVGSFVEMKSSGALDVSKLVSVSPGFWGGAGVETNNPPESDIMGDTTTGELDAGFAFNPGTDLSGWVGDMFTNSNFSWSLSGTTQFATYIFSGPFRTPGITIDSDDLLGGLWTPDVTWQKFGNLASLGLTPGIYPVVDAVTNESITIKILKTESVPGPLAILGVAAAFRRSRMLRLAIKSRA